MSAEGPGQRFSTLATKATAHGAPAIEYLNAGQARNPDPGAVLGYPTLANRTLAQQIGVGKPIVIISNGLMPYAASYFSALTVAPGNRLWIKDTDNSITNLPATALTSGVLTATWWKFGTVDSIDPVTGDVLVNHNNRSLF